MRKLTGKTYLKIEFKHAQTLLKMIDGYYDEHPEIHRNDAVVLAMNAFSLELSKARQREEKKIEAAEEMGEQDWGLQ